MVLDKRAVRGFASRMDWDLTSFFPAVVSAEFRDFREALERQAGALRPRVEALALDPAADVDVWVRLLLDLEDFRARLSHLGAYLSCLTAADTADEAATTEESAFSALRADAETIGEGLVAALRRVSADRLDALLGDKRLEGAEFYVCEAKRLSAHRMDLPREALSAALSVNGTKAWNQLYSRLSGDLTFAVPSADGTVERVPMARRANLLASPDRAVREAAFTGGNEAWAGYESVCERALNAIAGARLTLDRERGVEHFLDNACRGARLRRETLDAMFTAINDAAPALRALGAYRAQLLGEPHVSYRDLAAPAFIEPENEPPLEWDAGCRLVGDAFASAYPALGAFFRESLEARWYDHSPRRNKRPGGFCTTSRFNGESRVYMSYEADLGSVLTLAHEVGHAWHSRLLREVRPFASGYPMTLAESASTFAEMILVEGVLESDAFSADRKLALLDTDLRRAVIFTLELPVRFYFEKRFYEDRRKGFVPARRLRELMVAEQKRSFGDVLGEDGADPLFWASKQHFYADAVMFYNFPYTFGYLLSQSLFARFREEGSSFLGEYERFLAHSGQMNCEDLVRGTLGEAIDEPAFWSRALRPLEELRGRLAAFSTRCAG
ncbi:MAG: hypothetical protein JJU00_11665 [Opitutales bacterium]|nr:hypothetical protein [Opitutales bacterium]